MVAGDFARMRSAETGSWLLPEWRGQGLGREAREAMLHLLFDGLGAREGRSTGHPEHAPSDAVSRGRATLPGGTLPMPAAGEAPVTATRLLLTREHWRRRTDVVLAG